MVPTDAPLYERVLAFAQSTYALERGLVWAFQDHDPQWPKKVTYDRDVRDNITAGSTVRVDGLENFNLKIYEIVKHIRETYDHIGPITASVYICSKGSPDIPWSSDPDGLWLKVLRGTKDVHFENGANVTKHELSFDQSIYISPLTRFRLLNRKASMMLSVRMGRFIEDVLNEGPDRP